MTISLILALVGVLELRSDSITILGLELVVNQKRLVSLFQIATVFALLLFAIRIAQAFPKDWHRFISYRDRKWEKRIRHELNELEAELRGDHPGPFGDDYDSSFLEEHWERRQKRQRLLEIRLLSTHFFGYFLDVALPCILALTVIMNPELLASFLPIALKH